MPTCKDVNEFLAEYVAGELPMFKRMAFEAHLALCGDCRRFVADYRRTIALGKDALRTDDDRRGVPEELVHAVIAIQKRM